MYGMYHICKIKKKNTDHLTSAKIKGVTKAYIYTQLSQDVLHVQMLIVSLAT
jgi:hypothetical protein